MRNSLLLVLLLPSVAQASDTRDYQPFVYELEYNTVEDELHVLRQVIFRTSTGDIRGWREQQNVTVWPQVEGGLFDATWIPVPVAYRMIRFTKTTYDAEVIFREARVNKDGKPIVRRGIRP